MQTALADFIKDTPDGREADEILRTCVHCGFCLATCPTYQLLGDELDGPRGRIYLIKQVLEGTAATEKTQLHLDRCLTCRSCETTCPSGVKYGRLLDIGRHVVDQQVGRSQRARAGRFAPTDRSWIGASPLRLSESAGVADGVPRLFDDPWIRRPEPEPPVPERTPLWQRWYVLVGGAVVVAAAATAVAAATWPRPSSLSVSVLPPGPPR